MGKNSKQRRQATVDELSWAREYAAYFFRKNNMFLQKSGILDICEISQKERK